MGIAVLGGAGYIGSHAVDELITRGYEVVVIDNLRTGHRESIHKRQNFMKEIFVIKHF